MPGSQKPFAQAASKIPGPVGDHLLPARSLPGRVGFVGDSKGVGPATVAVLRQPGATVVIGIRNGEEPAQVAT